MKRSLIHVLIISVILMLAVILRPEVGYGAGVNADKVDGFDASATPTANWLLSLNGDVKFPNSVLYTGSGNGFDADLLDGLDSTVFQRKTIAKYARIGGGPIDTTTATPSSPVDMPGTTITFSSQEITGDTDLVINWASRITNTISGVHVHTLVYVDGSLVTETLVASPLSGTWTQHAANAVVGVSSGAHTIKVQWSNWEGNGTASVADRDLTVLAIPK